MDVSKSICDEEQNMFLEMKEEGKVFCVKLVLWSILSRKGTNMLIFDIFEYGAAYGPESGAK